MTIHTLLTPDESVVTLIDLQPQMMFGVASDDRLSIINNAVALAKAAKLFNVPVVLTTVAAKTFSGDLLPEIQSVFPDRVVVACLTYLSIPQLTRLMDRWLYP